MAGRRAAAPGPHARAARLRLLLAGLRQPPAGRVPRLRLRPARPRGERAGPRRLSRLGPGCRPRRLRGRRRPRSVRPRRAAARLAPLPSPRPRPPIATALGQGEHADARSGLYANRYDRRLADITTKAAIPEISYLWDSLTRVQCPTLVLRGEHSPILDDEISSRMVESLPDGRLYVFKDTGHSLPRLSPEEFAAVLRGFLLAGTLPAA